jgi:hypothetical protein
MTVPWDALARVDLAETRHVPVQRAVAAAMVEDHHVAVAVLLAGELHRASPAAMIGVPVARRSPRPCACAWCRGSGAAGAEGRAEPREGDRHADEALLQRPAVDVVLGLAVAVEAERGIGLAAGGEGRGLDLALPKRSPSRRFRPSPR